MAFDKYFRRVNSQALGPVGGAPDSGRKRRRGRPWRPSDRKGLVEERVLDVGILDGRLDVRAARLDRDPNADEVGLRRSEEETGEEPCQIELAPAERRKRRR